MRPHVVKAVIRILDGAPLVPVFPVMFNPAEITIEHSATFQETGPPGLNNPILQFVHGNAQILTVDLLFDTYTDGRGIDVSWLTGQFTSTVKVDGSLHAPPRVEFRWGRFAFQAVVEKISEKFTMFLSDGTPVRATLSVTFKQYKSIADQLKEPRRLSADKTKRRVLEVHDSIFLMANREYGDPKFWRRIAHANGIDDPRSIEPGTILVVPPVESQLRAVSRAT